MSALWADDFPLSLKRSMLPALILLASLGFAKHWDARQLCRFTFAITSFFLVVGIGIEIINGVFLQGSDYRFAGTLHPNSQAVNCAAFALASLALYYDARFQNVERWSVKWLLPFFAGVIFLFLTGSRTGTVAFLAALAAFFVLGSSRMTKVIALGMAAMVAAMLAVVFFDAGSDGGSLVLNLVQMGRQQDASEVASLTGRIPIWHAVLGDIANRPLFGYGYGGFWSPTRVLEYSYIHDWDFTHAHSAYLETMLNLGIAGLALGLVVVLSAAWFASREYGATRDAGYLFIAAVLTMALVHGILDSNFVSVGFAPLLATLCISIIAMHGRHEDAEE